MPRFLRPVRRGQYQVTPTPTIALKIAPHKLLAEKGVKRSELARQLGVWHREVRRILDPRVPNKAGRLRQALGRDAAVVVYDAAAKDRRIDAVGPTRPRPAPSRRSTARGR